MTNEQSTTTEIVQYRRILKMTSLHLVTSFGFIGDVVRSVFTGAGSYSFILMAGNRLTVFRYGNTRACSGQCVVGTHLLVKRVNNWPTLLLHYRGSKESSVSIRNSLQVICSQNHFLLAYSMYMGVYVIPRVGVVGVN
jgi:hypothetical protein